MTYTKIPFLVSPVRCIVTRTTKIVYLVNFTLEVK